MARAQRDFEAQFAELTGILDQLSTREIEWDRLKFRNQTVGSGGYGEVRKATLDDPESSNILAVKQLRTHGSKAERARVAVRLAREIYIMSKLSHPNIIHFIGFYVDRTDLRTACVIAPYMSNGNVGEYLEDNDVDIQKRLELALDAGQGLLYLHSCSPPICHADIKPENMLVTDDLHLVICDFGISQVMSETNRFTTTSSAKGSTVYMSPELFSADPRSTLKSDVWAWGCLVLQMTSGTGPYSELPSQHAIIGHITQGIKPAPVGLIMTEVPYLLHLLDTCWQFEPGRRLDMGECVSILSNIVDLGNGRDELPAAAVLHGLSRYRINPTQIVRSENIGRGGFGDVTAAQLLPPVQGSQSTATDVVIKETHFSYSDGDIKRQSMIFAQEVGLLSQLSHPNIIRFIGFVEDLHELVAWLITPRARYGNVRKFLESGTWGLTHRISLLWDIATGVEYLHTFRPPIIHGDLKSLNVVVNEEGHAEIIDFGSARMIETPDLEGSGFSTRWASPERLQDDSSSLESDIWALGWTFWEVLTGRVPFGERPNDAAVIVSIIQGNLPSLENADDVQIQTLRDLMMDCWRPDPTQRPRAGEVRGALRYMPRTPPVTVEGAAGVVLPPVRFETGSADQPPRKVEPVPGPNQKRTIRNGFRKWFDGYRT